MPDRPISIQGPRVTIPPAYSWGSQVRQYPKVGTPGISLFEGDMSQHGLMPVLCLCWRDGAGLLRGVLNYYQQDSVWETKGNANVFVDPEWYGQGIGTALLLEGIKRWAIDLTAQRYTAQGAPFVARLIQKEIVKW